jgi:hypothetical protein
MRVVISEGEWCIEIRQYSRFNYAGFFLGFPYWRNELDVA